MARPPARVRRLDVAYLLWALGLVGVCGLHRFYARKPISGTLWLLSLGLCGVGQMVDLFVLAELTSQANRGLLAPERLGLDRQLLALARRRGPQGFTFNDALLELHLPVDLPREEVRRELEGLLHDHLLDVGNDPEGRVIYREP